jgi:hypothetical protein
MSGSSDMGKHEPQPICVVILTDQSEAEGAEAFRPLNTIERTQGLQPRSLLLAKHQSPRQWVPHVWILRHGKARAPSGRIVILRTGAPGAPWTTLVVHGVSRAKDLLLPEASIRTTMGAPSWRSPRERNIRGVVKVDCEFTPLEGSVSKSILSRGDSASAPFHWKTNAPEPFADALSSAHCGNRFLCNGESRSGRNLGF